MITELTNRSYAFKRYLCHKKISAHFVRFFDHGGFPPEHAALGRELITTDVAENPEHGLGSAGSHPDVAERMIFLVIEHYLQAAVAVVPAFLGTYETLLGSVREYGLVARDSVDGLHFLKMLVPVRDEDFLEVLLEMSLVLGLYLQDGKLVADSGCRVERE